MEIDLEDNLGDDNLAPEPKTRRRRKGESEKRIRFMFEGYSKSWPTGRFSKLPDEAKLLMCVEQVRRPSYDCFDTPEAKMGWVLTMVNKGRTEDGRLSDDGIAELVWKCEEQGYLSQNGDSPQATEEGIKYIKKFKARK